MRHTGDWRWKTAARLNLAPSPVTDAETGPKPRTQRSETLPVDDSRAGLVVLAFGDPHLLEGAQRRQDGTANPHRVLALGWGNHLDLHRGGSQSRQLLRHALTDASEHGGASGQHHIPVEVLADVHVALHD